MNQYQKWQYQCIAKEMTAVLKEKCYDVHYAETLEDAKRALGGSETLASMGLVDIFRNGDYHFFDCYQKLPFSEIVKIYRQSMLADFLVTGTNAITRNGELVNIDSSGNRVAGIIFGPRRVIVVA